MINNKTIVHLSDLHFGTENTEVMWALEKAVSQISHDITVVSGDLTQRGRLSQFKTVNEFINRLPAVPKLLIPGNHDIPLFNIALRFIDPYRNYHAFFKQREAVIITENLILAGLDATTPYLHTRGRLTLEKTRKRLEDLSTDRPASKLLGLVIHQPIVVTRQTDIDNLLLHSFDLCEAFSEFKVDFVLSGHIHYPLICSVKEFNPSLSWATLFSGAGTALSYRTRDSIPNSFNSLKFQKEGNEVVIQRHDFIVKMKEFVVVESQKFLRTSLGWICSPC